MSEREIMDYLRERLGESLIRCESPRVRRVYAWVKPGALQTTVRALVDRYDPRFMTMTAVDHGLDVELLYHFSVGGVVATIRTTIPKEVGEVDSVAAVAPAANFIEREVSELFGVKFRGHPQPEDLILPKDWPAEKKPLRKPMEGALPPQARALAENLISRGVAPAVSTMVQKRREKAGLPATPPITYADESAMREFHELMKAVEFDVRAGYDWERKKLRYR